MEKFPIEQFVGQMNNPPDGLHPAPTMLRGFSFERQGGYRVFGNYRRLIHEGVYAFSPAGQYPLNVYDDSGLVAFTDPVLPRAVRILDAPGQIMHQPNPINTDDTAPAIINDVGIIYSKPLKTDRTPPDEPVGALRTEGGVLLPIPQGRYADGGQFTTKGTLDVALSSSKSGGTLSPNGWSYHILFYIITPGGLFLHSIEQPPYNTMSLGPTTDPNNTIDATFSHTGVTAEEGFEFVAHLYLKHSSDTAGDYVLAGSMGVDDTLQVKDPPLGPLLPALDTILTLRPKPGTHMVGHQGRYYCLLRGMVDHWPGPNTGSGAAARDLNDRAKADTMIAFSEPGYINMTNTDSWFSVSVQSGSGITGLSSTPAGLLIFSKGETQLLTGDPTTGDSNLKRMSSTIGHDYADRPPTRLGGAVYCINNGRVHQIVLGMGDIDFAQGVEEISGPVYAPDRPFLQVMADPKYGQLAAIRKQVDGSGVEVLRYDVHTQQWFTWPTRDVATDGFLLSASGPTGWYGAGLMLDNDTRNFYVPDINYDHTVAVEIAYDDLDLGSPFLMKSWRSVEVFLENPVPEAYAQFLRLFVIPQAGVRREYTPTVLSGGRRLLYKLDRRIVTASATIGFQVVNAGIMMPAGEEWPVIRPPIIISYAPRRQEQ